MSRRFPKITLVAAFALSACATAQGPGTNAPSPRGVTTMPAMNTFSPQPTARVTRSNSSIANDFMSLAFELESGRKLPVLSRFEEPISVRVTGATAPTLAPDLARLITRLRTEARIDIRQVARDKPAKITIEVISTRALQREVPNAACFVAPRVSSWNEFRRTRRTNQGAWSSLKERKTLSIFLPGDVSPQEIRDCLHEELAQALGPVNDLYHLADSVFNDDNFHAVLTGFDMLILRAFYAPQLHSGMTPAQVRSQLPQILSRLHPMGGAVRPISPVKTPANWKESIGRALGNSGSSYARRISAQQAVSIARARDWNDNRTAFSLFVLGRLSMSSDGALALSSFLQAQEIYASKPDTGLHEAHVALQLAAYSLSTRQPQTAVDLVNANFNAAMKAENASLLATLLMIKAQALDAMGQHQEADIIRLDSLGWARYGFGSNQEIRRRLSEIAGLSPTNQRADLR